MTIPPVLEAADLECERGGRTLFRALSVALEPGEALRVVGENGSGKTSLLRILCGLLAPSRGEVRWKGGAIRALREEYHRELLYLGHAPAVKAELSPAENLSIACTLAGVPAQSARVHAALARFGIPASVPVRTLSQGQRRRAALARLALSEVPLWLLDEPFSSLDAHGIGLLNDCFREQLGRGGALVFTTHQDPGFSATRVVELG